MKVFLAIILFSTGILGILVLSNNVFALEIGNFTNMGSDGNATVGNMTNATVGNMTANIGSYSVIRRRI